MKVLEISPNRFINLELISEVSVFKTEGCWRVTFSGPRIPHNIMLDTKSEVAALIDRYKGLVVSSDTQRLSEV